MTRRVLILVLVPLLACSGLAVAAATGAARPAAVPEPVERVHRFYAFGPSASYAGDSGGLSSVEPVTWSVPGEGSTTDAVVTVSFQYVAKGEGPFVIDLGVREVDGPRAEVRPDELQLAGAPDGTSTTVRFLVPDLERGRSYEAHIGVNSVFPEGRANRIGTRKVLVTIDMDGQ